jgi:PAS domain S-box-containing protein
MGLAYSYILNLIIVLVPGAIEGSTIQTLVLSGLLVVVTGLLIAFIIRSNQMSSRFREREAQYNQVKESLERLNRELQSQRDKVARELADTDKLHGILIESADDGISFYDDGWNLVFANSAFYSVIGFSRDEYDHKSSDNFIHPDDLDFTVKRKKALEEKGVFNSELRLRHRNGQYITLGTRTVQIKNSDGDVIGSVTISRDISSLKRIHEEIIRARDEAEASNRLKTSFMANISHEIRTPLNSVVGFANLLLADNLTSETREEYVDHINYNSEKLLQIIGDIIDLSRLESSQMEISYEEASVAEIVKEVTDDASLLIKRQEKPIILSVRNHFEEISDIIFTDRIWLKRVLSHLMDNAVKFTLEGTVELSYGLDGSMIYFRIKDTGIGIKKENLDSIFEEFRQEIDGHHRPFEGLGVGLTLVREVVERMGGKVTVDSEKGFGSEFGIMLPYRPAGTLRTKSRSEFDINKARDWSNKRCLLVDDNRDVLTYLKRILLDTGIEVITARSGPAAIDIVKKDDSIDLVLLDMQMPEMHGIEVTRELKKIKGTLPIIAQTAFVFEDDKDIILQAGCDACIVKPIRKEQLISVIGGFI